jgi:hypothetical protein
MAPREDDAFVTILRTGDAVQLAIARSILEEAGIVYHVVGDLAQDLFGLGRIGGHNFITGAPQLRVERERAEDARALLQPLEEGETPLDAEDGGEDA